jgi:glutamyl-tRNA(Gln) amidotransferase subunit E
MKEYRLNQKLAKQILDSEYCEVFEVIAKESGVSPTLITVFLTETLKALKRDGVQVDKVSENQVREIFKSVSTGELTKEALPDVFTWLSKHENKAVWEAVSGLGLQMISEDELRRFIEKVIAENRSVIRERGEKSFGILMGVVMKRLRGKVDAALVSNLLRKKMKEMPT